MNNFGNIRNRTKEAFEELCQHQTQVLLNPTSASYFAEAEASTRMQRLTLIEEKFVMQKSRIRWFTVGNQNTTFYHNVVLERSARNIIQILHTADGVPLLATEDIKHEAVNYFQKFLQADPTSSATSSYDELRDLLRFRCSQEDVTMLISPITPVEITSALQSLPNGKAYGPNRFTKEFYISVWPVIGKDFITAIQSFFLFGFLPTGVKSTILALIPKKIPAHTMKDYRPIACCNLMYKVISKLLANRLKAFLPSPIEPNQSAFVKGRLLLENVLLTTELVNGYHKPLVSDRSTTMLDISKTHSQMELYH